MPVTIRAGRTIHRRTLSTPGEADLTSAAELEAALAGQLSAGTRHVTVDLSGLRFADSAAIGALVRAARALKDQGGALDLAGPQPVVARALALLGVDQALTVRAEAEPEGA
jgi:anti-sigma B factor antagonist